MPNGSGRIAKTLAEGTAEMRSTFEAAFKSSLGNGFAHVGQ
jgi:hypothetical protein